MAIRWSPGGVGTAAPERAAAVDNQPLGLFLHAAAEGGEQGGGGRKPVGIP